MDSLAMFNMYFYDASYYERNSSPIPLVPFTSEPRSGRGGSGQEQIHSAFDAAIEQGGIELKETLIRLKSVVEQLSWWNACDVARTYLDQQSDSATNALVEMADFINSLPNGDLFRYKVMSDPDLIQRLFAERRYTAFGGPQSKTLIKMFKSLNRNNDEHFVRLIPSCSDKLKVILPKLNMCRSHNEKILYVDQCLLGDDNLPADQFADCYKKLPPFHYPAIVRDTSIVKQITPIIDHPISHMCWLSFMGELGVDVGGVTREVLTLAANEIKVAFGEILTTTEVGLLTLNLKVTASKESYTALGSLLFWMVAKGVVLPERIAFDSEFYHDIAQFSSKELSRESFNVMSQKCSNLKKTKEIFLRFYPPTDHEVLGATSDKEFKQAMVEMIALKEGSFYVARGLSCGGKVRCSPLLQYALSPGVAVWPLLQEKENFIWEDIGGDEALLKEYFFKLMRDASEEQAKKFVVAVTSVAMLPYDRKITIKTHGVGHIALPRVSSCEHSYFFPQIPTDDTVYQTTQHDSCVSFRDYEVFKKWFFGTLDDLQQGFGLV